MSVQNDKNKFKEFGATSWSVTNKTAIYLLIIICSVWGIIRFTTTPKESFPDIVIPTIYIQTIYVGNSPKDIENLVTKPIEKQIKSITGAKINKITSTSQQDYSAIVIEFDTEVKVDIALQKTKDAIDKSKQDLPTDLTQQPTALEVSFSDQPIMYVNISGNYDLQRLKKYADDMQDDLENLPQLNRVDEVGAPEREFQINVDRPRMEAAGVSFGDIANTVAAENNDITGGLLQIGDMKRTLQVRGQFKTAYDIQKVVVKNIYGNPVYLKDIADIKDTLKTSESYARLDNKNVLTLNIIKRSGENLIETSDAVKAAVAHLQDTKFPKDLKIVITGDQSKATKNSFRDLVNSIVIGFILVLVILMFFMGVVNAFFVALSVPLSMFIAFVFLPAADLIIGTHVTLNFMVLFALLFGLGIIVDDAIVVIENTHRIFTQSKGRLDSTMAAKMAAGEVFVPVLTGTLTTLAPFFPLLFWPGIIGKFMIYLPAMLIFTLAASLIVAFLMNPVFAVDFMNHEEGRKEPKSAIFRKPSFWIFALLAVLLDVFGAPFAGNLLLLILALIVLNRYVFEGLIHRFQNRALPWIMNHYETLLRWALNGRRPVGLLVGTFALLVFSFMFFNAMKVPVEFFPTGDPNQIYVYLKLPVGTDVEYTDSVTRQLETKVYKILGMDNGRKNAVVESVISNVAVGANDPNSGDQSTHPELGRIQVSFVEYGERDGVATRPFLDSIRASLKGIPGAQIAVDQENGGPPTDPPVNIEIASDEFDDLTKAAASLKNYLDSIQVPGVEELKMDVDLTNPEITLNIDREKANIEGLSTLQIGSEIRTAVFGREVSKVKEGEDEYKIQLRDREMDNAKLTDLLNMNISFRSPTGAIKTLPISSFVNVDYTSTVGSVKRKKYNRVITLTSNILSGYTTTTVNQQLAGYIQQFRNKPDGVTITQTGESAQQDETFSFLGQALMITLMLILLILVLQFNSISKPVIILTEIIFSIIGVLLGFSLTGMSMSIVMTGIGIVGLAGIVVKNGILVIEFADELRARGLKTREAVIQAGKTRIIPVMLTALAAILALIPLAVGFNINFVTLFSELDPHIYFGGDNTVFWKPLSWTIIFGLAFAFFMTLIILPAMYLIAERLKRPMRNMYGGKWISILGIPPLTLLFIPLMIITSVKHRVQMTRRAFYLNNESMVEKPKSVIISLNLLKFSLLLSLIGTIVQLAMHTLELNTTAVVILLLTWSLTILTIYGISNQQNWARTLLLVITIVGTLLSLYFLPVLFTINLLGAIIGTTISVIQLIALMLLYLGESRIWFKLTKNIMLLNNKANNAFIGSWF